MHSFQFNRDAFKLKQLKYMIRRIFFACFAITVTLIFFF